jgi:transcriptional regulator with XRE-family HTH domain
MIDRQALYTQVGNRIKEKREQLGLTQKTLASLVGLKRTSVTNIELGNQKLLLHTLVELAHALQVSTAELLGEPTMTSDVTGGIDELLKDRPRSEQDWIRAALNSPENEG